MLAYRSAGTRRPALRNETQPHFPDKLVPGELYKWMIRIIGSANVKFLVGYKLPPFESQLMGFTSPTISID